MIMVLTIRTIKINSAITNVARLAFPVIGSFSSFSMIDYTQTFVKCYALASNSLAIFDMSVSNHRTLIKAMVFIIAVIIKTV